ncbi:MAG: DNA polymerase III subunit beta [Clostridiales bacterium]|nr:MAG: DNA polymerase III subunit beta [Clostridiales bacterium]
MKFIVAQKDLIYAINILSKAISTRTTIDVLKGFYIETEENHIVMKSNDLNFSIVIKIPAHIKEKGNALVESSLISDIVRKLPDDAISIETDGESLYVICGESNYRLSLMDSETFPQIPEVDGLKKTVINQAVFSNMIKMTNFAVSKDEKSPILTGSLINIKDKIIEMVSVGGFTIAVDRANVKESDEIRVVIPGRILNEIQKIISYNVDDDIEIFVGDKYALFKFDNVKIISKLLEGNYVNYEQIINLKQEIVCKINTKEMYRALDRVSLLANKSKEHTVIFEFEDDKLTVSADTFLGSAVEKISSFKNGKNIRIGFNPNFILKALRNIEREEILVGMNNPLSPCSIKPTDDDDFCYFFSPVRI